MRRKHFSNFALFLGASLILASFFVSFLVLAQEEGMEEMTVREPELGEVTAPEEAVSPEEFEAPEAVEEEIPEEVSEALEKAAEEALKEEERPEELKIDEEINPEDLGVEESRILPDSPLYFFKDAGRKIKRALTFDPVKKSEVALDQASAKMIEAKQLLLKEGAEEGAFLKAVSVIEKAEKDLELIAKKAEDIKEKKEAEVPGVEEFLDKAVDYQIKQQKLLQHLGEKVPEHAFVKIEEARERNIKHLGEVMARVAERHEEITERIDRVLVQQAGSGFKELKNLEVLEELKEKMPEEARDAVSLAQEASMKRFQEKFQTIPPEARQEKITGYLENMRGNALRQFEVLDQMKTMTWMDEDLVKEIDLLKDKAVRKFEKHFERLKTEEGREKLTGHLTDGDPEDFRIMSQIEMRLPPPPEMLPPLREMPPEGAPIGPPPGIGEAMKEFHQQAVTKFKERFGNDPEALRRSEAVKKALENPDAADFKLIKEIEENMPPEQRAFAEKMKEEVKQKMIERFGPPPPFILIEEGMPPMPPPPPFMMEQFIDPNPQSLEILRELREELPEEARRGIEQAIGVQVKRMGEHMETMDDPIMFERMSRKIRDKEEIRQEVLMREADFMRKTEKRERELRAEIQELEKMKMQRREEMKQQMQRGEFEFLPPMMPPEAQKSMEMIKERFMPPPGMPPPSPAAPAEMMRPKLEDEEKRGIFDRMRDRFNRLEGEPEKVVPAEEAVPLKRAPDEAAPSSMPVPPKEPFFAPEEIKERQFQPLVPPAFLPILTPMEIKPEGVSPPPIAPTGPLPAELQPREGGGF